VFQVVAQNGGQSYFLKVHHTAAKEAGVAIPHFLYSQGIHQVLAAIPTKGGELAFMCRGRQLVLYPFLAGHVAIEVGLTAEQWTELGVALKAIHSQKLPDNLLQLMEREVYSPEFRVRAAGFLRQALAGVYDHGPCSGMAELLRARKSEIEHMISRAEELAGTLASDNERPFVVCHADLHKWNIQVEPGGELLILDWDSLKLAPKECDLMYIGGNIGGYRGDEAEEASFYRGYGDTRVDLLALTYYRYERIVTDIALYCQEVWEHPGVTAEACDQIVRRVANNFPPGSELEAARRADAWLGDSQRSGSSSTWGDRS
jgi:spectinomycin phosphotransferase